jgi:hypothetical protein
MRIAVILGYNPHSPDWKYVAWGDPQNHQRGRIPTTLKLLCDQSTAPNHIIWTGGHYGESKNSEAQHHLDFTLKHLYELHTHFGFPRGFADWVKCRLPKISLLEEEAQDTSENAGFSIALLTSKFNPSLPLEISIITSITHLSRACRDFLTYQKQYPNWRFTFIPSQTHHHGLKIDEIDVYESMKD